MKKNRQQPLNLLELRPHRNAEWEVSDEGFVVLLIPKFRNRYLAKWLLPRLAKRNFRVKLDKLGSFVWQHCDGKTPVAAMAEEILAEFGSTAEPVYDRIGKFLLKLEREHFLVIPKPVSDQ